MNHLSSKLLLLSLSILTNIISTTVRAENTSTSIETSKRSASILEAIISLFKTSERPFITRNNKVCPISFSNPEEQLIWSDRPLFIWQGETFQSEINLYSAATNSDREDELVWTEIIAPDTQTIAYTGEQLQPGSTYNWELISSGNTYRQTITLMEQSSREAIAADLITLESKLQGSNATAEDIAIAKADYFVEKKLGFDALQQLYLVKKPSSDLTALRTDIEENLCNLNS